MVVGFQQVNKCGVMFVAWREFLWQHKNLDLVVAHVYK